MEQSEKSEDNRSSKEQSVPVLISGELYRDLQGEFADTGFASIEEYVNYLLRVAMGKKIAVANEEEFSGLSDDENEIVSDRLKALGYL